jgi:agmatinase
MASTLARMFGSGRSTTFLGLPGEASRPDIVLMGADTATPYEGVGAYCAGGADAIRAGAADFAANLGHVNFDLGGPTVPDGACVVDAGQIETDPKDAAGNRARIAARVAGTVQTGAVPVLLGGDDSLPIPMLEGLAGRGAPVWVVQVDAHVDWRDEVGGERFGLSSGMRRASEMGHVAGLVQVGARGIGSARPDDLRDARARGAHLVPMRDLARTGVAAALAPVPEGARVALVFDWDVLDPAIMPAVIARTPGGMDYWSAVELIAALAGRGRIVAASFAEFMPDRDIDGQGARTAAGLVATTLGCIARARAGV